MYPKAYIEYLVYFHGPRDYFECHEVLEEHWKKDPPDKRKSYWVALIQISVALYHQRIKNYNGAKRLLKNALNIIKNEKKALKNLSLDFSKLVTILNQRYEEICSQKAYDSFNLPITDEALLDECRDICKQRGYTWGQSSDLSNKQLIYKHSLRDRSDVIFERRRQQQLKEQKRKGAM